MPSRSGPPAVEVVGLYRRSPRGVWGPRWWGEPLATPGGVASGCVQPIVRSPLLGDEERLELPGPQRRPELELTGRALQVHVERLARDVGPCEQVRLIVEHDLLELLVDGRSLVLVTRDQTLVDQRIRLGVLVADVVEQVRLLFRGALLRVEQGIWIGIEASAPPTEVGVVRLVRVRRNVREGEERQEH